MKKHKEAKFKSAKSIEESEIKWTSKMSVNDPQIDAQHKMILGEIEILKGSLNSDEPLVKARECIHFLSVYIKEHLDYEEKYMQLHKFPYFNEHKSQHDHFREQYKQFNEGLSLDIRGKPNVKSLVRGYLQKFLDFLAEWWVNHIAIEDHMYAEWITKHEKENKSK